MYRLYIVLLIPVFVALIYSVKRWILLKPVSNEYIVVLFFVLCLPFGYGFSFWDTNGMDRLAGPLGLSFKFGYIQVSLLSAIILSKSWKLKIGNSFFSHKRILLLLLLLFVAIVNPKNQCYQTSLIGVYSLFSIFLFLFIVNNSFNFRNVGKAFWDGIVFVSLLQFVLSLCFPVLDIYFVTRVFHDNVGRVDMVQELAHRVGAVGTFDHPGKLGLYMSVNTLVFFSFFLLGIRRSFSGFMLVVSLVVVLLTVSRTSVLFVLVAIFLLYFINRFPRLNFLSPFLLMGSLTVIVGLAVVVFYIVPLDQFVIDANVLQMVDARLAHFRMGIEIFKNSPLIGVGVNSHLAYAREFISEEVIGAGLSEDFAFSNPIHNIHLIVLVELGLLGLILWGRFVFFEFRVFRENFLIIEERYAKALNLAGIGVLFIFITYGMTGWSPFTEAFLAYGFFIFSFIGHLNNNYAPNGSRVIAN